MLILRPIILILTLCFTSTSFAEITKINQSQSKVISSNSFEILVWNIYGGKKQGFENDFLSIVESYDFILLQEANLAKELEEVFIKTEPAWTHATSFVWNNKKMGVSTGSNIKPSQSTRLLSKNRELGFTTRKTSLIQLYEISGSKQQLMIVNTHAINFRGTDAYKQEVDQILDAIKSHSGPVIFAGDFNAWKQTRADYLVLQTKNMGFKEVSFQKQRTSSPFNKDLPLDRIFFKGLKLISSDVLDQINSSDHLPLSAKFEF